MSFIPTNISDPALAPLIEIQENIRLEFEGQDAAKVSIVALLVDARGANSIATILAARLEYAKAFASFHP